MNFCISQSNSQTSGQEDPRRYARLRQLPLLQDGAFELWHAGSIGAVGGGVLGSHLVPELVRSGIGNCVVFDSDLVSMENLGTQCFTLPGVYKTDALRDQCNSIREGVLQSRPIDVRHAGVGELASLDTIVDATDDPNLQWPLTEISNGLGIPMLRIAVDGSGECELGRIQVSHGGRGYACRLCSKSLEQLIRNLPRTPCPHVQVTGSPPTIAGNGIAMAVAGLALTQLQRLICGKSDNRTYNSQIIIDLDNFRIIALLEPRSEKCVSGHVVWDLIPAGVNAAEIALGEVFDIAGRLIGWPVDVIEPYNHPLYLSARCECGKIKDAIGTRWAEPPYCDKCHQAMNWELHTQKPSWTRLDAENAGILSRTMVELGLPAAGAMVLARKQDKPTKRIVFS
ncbi:MAG: ThiF family adenylyltransferase [Thermoguttaceae bacterium]|jgi:tRNA A37 threonylcarbamoyladenosine dehydratase